MLPAVDLQPAVDFVRDFVGFLRERKRFWLLPLLVVLLLMGLLVVATHGSALAPLIYTIF
jgi:hypothetical protein